MVEPFSEVHTVEAGRKDETLIMRDLVIAACTDTCNDIGRTIGFLILIIVVIVGQVCQCDRYHRPLSPATCRLGTNHLTLWGQTGNEHGFRNILVLLMLLPLLFLLPAFVSLAFLCVVLYGVVCMWGGPSHIIGKELGESILSN